MSSHSAPNEKDDLFRKVSDNGQPPGELSNDSTGEPLSRVKREPLDEPAIHDLCSSTPSLPRKRRRVEVVVPTLAQVKQRKLDLKADYAKLEKLKNPKVKMIPNMQLHVDTTRDRLLPIGIDLFDITLAKAYVDFTVSRDFMASVYGGSMQATCPTIAEERVAQHGYDKFVYCHLDYQPHAPQVPGAPGLFFGTGGGVGKDWAGLQKVFARLKSNVHCYMGEYEVRYSTPLTQAEWMSQTYQVRKTWATEICAQGWGTSVRVRVQARKESAGRRPSQAKLRAVVDSGRYKNTTPDDIMSAYTKGEENLTVWTMKCVGYDEVFQLELNERFPHWSPPPRRPRTKNNGNNRRKKAIKTEDKKNVKIEAEETRKTLASAPLGRKRKLSESETSDSEADVGLTELDYTPRGTRTRPRRD